MCGLIFLSVADSEAPEISRFRGALMAQSWRGPDSCQMVSAVDGKVLLGVNRLEIVDPGRRSDQPMVSACGNFIIIFNGEIYNYCDLRSQLALKCRTNGDTEVVLEGYAAVGPRIVDMLEGMFAFVIYDIQANEWFAARDRLGIKPLYYYERDGATAFGSEAASLAKILDCEIDQYSLLEWQAIRRPVPGYTYFRNIREHLPGTWRKSSERRANCYWSLQSTAMPFDQEEFEDLLVRSVKAHELSDVRNVAFLSGGLDSAILTCVSSVSKCYCVGLDSNNEFDAAKETAIALGKELHCVSVTYDELVEAWRELSVLRGEPLSVPNEGLIYIACRHMAPDEKVVISGEGADEALFGYDRLFRWAQTGEWKGIENFLMRYGYANKCGVPSRLGDYIERARIGKDLSEFVEDFFLDIHLGGLLRRLDFASMAASKEARVPFLDRRVVEYMYRRSPSIKISASESKIPLRIFAAKLGLAVVLDRQKIGFSAIRAGSRSKMEEYAAFRKIVLEALGW